MVDLTDIASLLDAYALFYLLCAAIGAPAILLTLVLAKPRRATLAAAPANPA